MSCVSCVCFYQDVFRANWEGWVRWLAVSRARFTHFRCVSSKRCDVKPCVPGRLPQDYSRDGVDVLPACLHAGGTGGDWRQSWIWAGKVGKEKKTVPPTTDYGRCGVAPVCSLAGPGRCRLSSSCNYTIWFDGLFRSPLQLIPMRPAVARLCNASSCTWKLPRD